MSLSTNYVDDIINTDVNTSRKYTMISNSDGTVSFIDATAYLQLGSAFTMGSLNTQNALLNSMADDGENIEAGTDKLVTRSDTFSNKCYDYIPTITSKLTSLGVSTAQSATVSTIIDNANTMATNYYNSGVAAVKVGTAGTGQVLSGRTFTNSQTAGLTGTMPNYSGSPRTVTCNGNSGTQTYDIADGYHTHMIVNQSAPYSAAYNSYYPSAYNTGHNSGHDRRKSENENLARVDNTYNLIWNYDDLVPDGGIDTPQANFHSAATNLLNLLADVYNTISESP